MLCVLTLTPLMSSMSPRVTGCLYAIIEIVSINAFEILGARSFQRCDKAGLNSCLICSLYPEAISTTSRDESVYLVSNSLRHCFISDSSAVTPSNSSKLLISDILKGLPEPNNKASTVLIILMFNLSLLLILKKSLQFRFVLIQDAHLWLVLKMQGRSLPPLACLPFF